MKGSYHLATVSGIPVKIHWSFGLLLLYTAYVTSQGGFHPLMVLFSIGIVLSIFFCVILHEFGHALAARKYGVKTFDIVMTPIGGIARLERMPEGRGQEFWVAIAGPTVNFIIVAVIWLGYFVFAGKVLPLFSLPLWQFENQPPSYFMILMLSNGYLGTFNLLPAFPMDGGRMLRSLLSLRMERDKATQIASHIGQALAMLLFGFGIWKGQPTMTLIGIFIFIAARQENKTLQQQTKLLKAKAADFVDPVNHQFYLGQTMDEARTLAQQAHGNAFMVWSRPGIPAGYITRERLIPVYPPSLPDRLIDPWVIPAPVVIPMETPAMQLIAFMQQHKLPVLLVSDATGYAGVVQWEKVEQWLK